MSKNNKTSKVAFHQVNKRVCSKSKIIINPEASRMPWRKVLFTCLKTTSSFLMIRRFIKKPSTENVPIIANQRLK